LLDADYEPSKADFLQLKIITHVITDTIFRIQNSIVHVYDMIGLRQGRAGWSKYFSDCKTIMFFVALDCYDQTMEEDQETNRMQDSIQLFQKIVDDPALLDSTIILFLNKKDLYEKKVKTVPISLYFPNYTGKEGNSTQGAIFFKEMLLASCESQRMVHTQVTCCIDPVYMQNITTSLM
jgi:hypothetical protein